MPCGQTHSQSPSTPTHSIQRRSATHRKTARNHRQPSKTTKQTCLHAILPRLSCSLSPNHPRSGQLLRFFHFARQPFSLPLLLRIPPHRNRNRARTKPIDFTLVGRIASHREANLHQKAARQQKPSTSRYTALLSTQHGPFVHPSLDCTAPSWPIQIDTAQPRHALRPPSRRAPCYLSFRQLHFLVFRSPRRACVNHLSYLARCLTDMHST